MRSTNDDNDVVDLREIGAALRRGIAWIVGGVLVGALVAITVSYVLEPEYEASATVLVRTSPDVSQAITSRLGGLAGVLPGVDGSGIGTEIKILTSRAVVGEVVDSLGLQARIVEPERLRPAAIFEMATYSPDLREGRYRFERNGSVYQVTGPEFSGRVSPGLPADLPGATVVLRSSHVPHEFEIELVDREDAIAAVRANLEANASGGDIAELAFRAPDPAIAAAVPNSLVAKYLRRRMSTDRGVNQRRYEFLTQHADSIATELVTAEAALRTHQEQSGVADPAVVGQAQLQRAMALRTELEAAEVEAGALRQVLTQIGTGSGSARQLAAYPTFLRNAAINNVLSRLLEMETRRGELLERRTERDPDVVTITKSIQQLEDQLVSLSRSYLSGLERQQQALQQELGGHRGELATLPGKAEQSYRLQREVRRLTETLLALQGQLVQGRLAAIAEGGEVRLIDAAVPPKRPTSPKPLLNLGIGVFGGLLLGVVGALGSSYLGERVRDPRQAELSAGIPAVFLQPGTPLLLGGAGNWRGLLVLPVGTGARAGKVGRRIAATAALQGRNVVLADLDAAGSKSDASSSGSGPGTALLTASDGGSPAHLERVPAEAGTAGYAVYRGFGTHGNSHGDVRSAIEELEQRYSPVVTVLRGMEDPATAMLLSPERPVILVARVGEVTRSELRQAVRALEQIGVTTPGVVLHDGSGNGRRSA